MLVNNAAFQEHVNDFEDLTEEHFDRTLKTNLYGYFYMAKAAVPHMKPGAADRHDRLGHRHAGQQGTARLFDDQGRHPRLHPLARHAPDPAGIRVNAVAPGPVWTPLNPADKDAERVASSAAHTPMKRPAQPEEIAPAYVFLASPQCSSYITGEILPIIGGY